MEQRASHRAQQYRITCNTGVAGDMGSIPGLGRSPRVGNGNPFQYACLENSMDRVAYAVQGVAKNQKELSERAHSLKRETLHLIN